MYDKIYYEKNKERIRDYQKLYYEKYKERIIQNQKEYYKNNKQNYAQYYANNKEKLAKNYKSRDYKRKLELREYNRLYYLHRNKCKLEADKLNSEQLTSIAQGKFLIEL